MTGALRFLFALCAPLFFWGGAAAAQEEADAGGTTELRESPSLAILGDVELPANAPDYVAWATIAARAERLIEANRASDRTLETLRAQVVDWRSQFDAARSANSVRIATLKTQISALGAPAEDDSGAVDTAAAERAILTEELGQLEIPVRAAQVAFARANQIIAEIDEALATRQTDALLDLWPSPANPANWPGAWSEWTKSLGRIVAEVEAALERPAVRQELRASLLSILLLVAISALLQARGRRWIVAAGQRVMAGEDAPLRGVWTFLISLGQVVVPALGALIAVVAVDLTGLAGTRGTLLARAIAMVVIFVFTARWLGVRIFGGPGVARHVLRMRDRARVEGRVEAAFLGLAIGLSLAIFQLAEQDGYSEASKSVLQFPVLLVAGVLLARIGRLTLAHSVPEDEAGEGPGYFDRSLRLLGRALVLVGVVGPVAALIGQVSFAAYLLTASSYTLALIALLFTLHGFFVDLFGALTGRSRDEAGEALLPVLASLIMLLVSAPLFALIWGVRDTRFVEIWAAVKRGITFGETTIAPGDILTLVLIFAIGFGVTRLLQGMLKSTVLPKTKMDIGGRNAITSGIGYVGYFLAAVIAVTSVGINLSSLAVVAGALSVGIGFGLQTIVSNFVSGIILLVERPISEGDWIDVGGHVGIVKDISVRATRIETFDRTDVVVPNSDLISGVVTNYTRGNRYGRLVMDIGVAYGTDPKKVAAILTEIVENHPLVTVNPPPQVGFMTFGADALEFQIRAVLSDVFFVLKVRDEINHEIARRFDEEGIEVPFAQRDIWIRNPDALRGPASDGGEEG